MFFIGNFSMGLHKHIINPYHPIIKASITPVYILVKKVKMSPWLKGHVFIIKSTNDIRKITSENYDMKNNF